MIRKRIFQIFISSLSQKEHYGRPPWTFRLRVPSSLTLPFGYKDIPAKKGYSSNHDTQNNRNPQALTASGVQGWDSFVSPRNGSVHNSRFFSRPFGLSAFIVCAIRCVGAHVVLSSCVSPHLYSLSFGTYICFFLIGSRLFVPSK